MSTRGNRDKGAATSNRQSKHKPAITIQPPVETVTEPVIVVKKTVKSKAKQKKSKTLLTG